MKQLKTDRPSLGLWPTSPALCISASHFYSILWVRNYGHCCHNHHHHLQWSSQEHQGTKRIKLIFFLLLFFFFLIQVELIYHFYYLQAYNIVIQCLFLIVLYWKLLLDNDYSCATQFILVAYQFYTQQSVFLNPLPQFTTPPSLCHLVTTGLFSMSLSLFLFFIHIRLYHFLDPTHQRSHPVFVSVWCVSLEHNNL